MDFKNKKGIYFNVCTMYIVHMLSNMKPNA